MDDETELFVANLKHSSDIHPFPCAVMWLSLGKFPLEIFFLWIHVRREFMVIHNYPKHYCHCIFSADAEKLDLLSTNVVLSTVVLKHILKCTGILGFSQFNLITGAVLYVISRLIPHFIPEILAEKIGLRFKYVCYTMWHNFHLFLLYLNKLYLKLSFPGFH